MHMAVVGTDKKHWTASEWRELPDDRNRYEIIDSALFVTPAPMPPHQRLVGELFLSLHAYANAHRIGDALMSPADIELGDDTVVQPDIFVARLVNGKVSLRWEDLGPLLLAIEVLSPGTARVDRTIKRSSYQRAGIAEYWIVDGDARVVERWRPADDRPEVLADRLEWQPDPAFPPLVIELDALFAAALGSNGIRGYTGIHPSRT